MTPSLSLKNWEYVLYPLDHPSASDTWDTTEGAITEKVGACLQSYEATLQYLVPKLSLQRLGYVLYLTGHSWASDTWAIIKVIVG